MYSIVLFIGHIVVSFLLLSLCIWLSLQVSWYMLLVRSNFFNITCISFNNLKGFIFERKEKDCSLCSLVTFDIALYANDPYSATVRPVLCNQDVG